MAGEEVKAEPAGDVLDEWEEFDVMELEAAY